jgi:crotonobetainyl-CoA:carnitine CoA-transferase CaiB-like acyl-CoA transferase
MAGKDAAIAILAALVGRQSLSARDRRIHISLSASATASLINVAQNALVTGRDAKRWGNQHPNLVPYQLFRAKDRPMIVAVGNDSQWIACTRALGLENLANDPSLASNGGRLANREKIIGTIQARLSERSAEEWITILDDAQVPCGRVKTVLEALREIDASALTGIAPVVPGNVRLAPPVLDENSDEIRARGWAAFANYMIFFVCRDQRNWVTLAP